MSPDTVTISELKVSQKRLSPCGMEGSEGEEAGGGEEGTDR